MCKGSLRREEGQEEEEEEEEEDYPNPDFITHDRNYRRSQHYKHHSHQTEANLGSNFGRVGSGSGRVITLVIGGGFLPNDKIEKAT